MNKVPFDPFSSHPVFAVRNKLKLNLVIVLFRSARVHGLNDLTVPMNVKDFEPIQKLSDQHKVFPHRVFFTAKMMNKHVQDLFI